LSSWVILLVRLVCLLFEPYSTFVKVLGEAAHAPALINSVVVCSVWWLVLVPAITFMIKTPAERMWFIKFNFSFFLLNVHAINLAFAYVISKMDPRPFVFFDLWCSLFVALVYVLFYQLVLDPRGIHLYIILSPRTHFSLVTYSMVIGVFVGCYKAAGGDMSFVSSLFT
jgi:hypothetical protein